MEVREDPVGEPIGVPEEAVEDPPDPMPRKKEATLPIMGFPSDAEAGFTDDPDSLCGEGTIPIRGGGTEGKPIRERGYAGPRIRRGFEARRDFSDIRATRLSAAGIGVGSYFDPEDDFHMNPIPSEKP